MAPGGKTARPLPFAPAPRPTPLFSVVRIETGTAPAGAPALARIAEGREALPEARGEPGFRFAHRDSPAPGVVLHLVGPDAANGEVLRLRMVEVEAADRGGRRHGIRLGEGHSGPLRIQQLEELRLLAVVGARGVAERGTNAAEVLLEDV